MKCKTYQHHTYVEISVFGTENATYSSSTHEWEDFLGKIDFDEIAARAAHDKPRKVISAEHLIKIWHNNLDSTKKTLNEKTQIKVRTLLQAANPRLTSNFYKVTEC